MGFPRRARITRGAELQRIAREGKRIRTTHLEVRVVPSPLASPEGSRTRVGLVVPRFRQSAVARNQLKRRLRELARHRLLPTDVAADIVIRIRPEAYRAGFPDLSADVDRAAVQIVRWRASAPEPAAPAVVPIDAPPPSEPGGAPGTHPAAGGASDT